MTDDHRFGRTTTVPPTVPGTYDFGQANPAPPLSARFVSRHTCFCDPHGAQSTLRWLGGTLARHMTLEYGT